MILPVMLVFLGTSLPGQEIDHWESIIRTGNACRYLVPAEEVDGEWTNPGFNDLLWIPGTGGVGYGDGDDNTVIDPAISVYCRYEFDLPDPGVIRALILDVDFDDGFVAYLNGAELGRSHMGPEGSATRWDQPADGLHEAELYRGGSPLRILLPDTIPEVLIAGENVLAIEVHNESFTSSDLSSNIFLHAGVSVESMIFQETPDWFDPPFRLEKTHLPLMVIDTDGRDIPDEPRITAHMGLIHNGEGRYNSPGDDFNIYDGRIAIEMRGESSLYFYPKKSYRIETQTDSGTNNNVPLLNFPRENDYVLYGPYGDKSLIRNVISYGMYEKMGHYAPRTNFIELVVNGDYRGVYVLTELIKRDNYRVDIAKIQPEDISDPEITGGYILRVDKTTGMDPYEYWESPVPPGVPGFNYIIYQYHDPGYDELNQAQRGYVFDYMQEFDRVFSSTNFTDPVYGYRPYMDIPSFIDIMILNEVTKDVDGYRLSHYFYKENDLNGGKLVNGPPWDYNLTFGNNDFAGDVNQTSEWVYPKFINIYWWERAMQDPWFRNRLYCRWDELQASVLNEDHLRQMIDSCLFELGSATDRNFQRWPILGEYVWPNSFIGTSYQHEISYLRTWIRERISWINSRWAGRCIPSGDRQVTIPLPGKLRIFPNPSDLSRTYLSVDDHFSGQHLPVKLTDLNGRVLYQGEMTPSIEGRTMVLPDLSFLPAGIYLLEVSDDKGIRGTVKVIRE
ncbi:MAG: CotH kinase family protein [Bacteroidales bacterium]